MAKTHVSSSNIPERNITTKPVQQHPDLLQFYVTNSEDIR
jgi:hypothetical protein